VPSFLCITTIPPRSSSSRLVLLLPASFFFFPPRFPSSRLVILLHTSFFCFPPRSSSSRLVLLLPASFFFFPPLSYASPTSHLVHKYISASTVRTYEVSVIKGNKGSGSADSNRLHTFHFPHSSHHPPHLYTDDAGVRGGAEGAAASLTSIAWKRPIFSPLLSSPTPPLYR